MLKAVAVQCSRLIIKHRNNAAVWVWVGLRPIDLFLILYISKDWDSCQVLYIHIENLG